MNKTKPIVYVETSDFEGINFAKNLTLKYEIEKVHKKLAQLRNLSLFLVLLSYLFFVVNLYYYYKKPNEVLFLLSCAIWIGNMIYQFSNFKKTHKKILEIKSSHALNNFLNNF